MMNNNTDLSILNPPVILGNSDVIQLLSSFKDGTEEVKNALMYECRVILECKICNSLFRGLPNFLAHKRKYCQEHFCKDKQLSGYSRVDFQTTIFDSFDGNPEVQQTKTTQVHSDAERDTPPEERQLLEGEAQLQLSSIIKNVNSVNQNASGIESTTDIPELKLDIENLSVNNETDPRPEKGEEPSFKEADNQQVLSEVESWTNMLKDSQKSDPHQKKVSTKYMHEVYMKILSRYSFCDVEQLNCKKCHSTYQSFKSLKRHVLTKHITGLKQYICSKCGAAFSKAYEMKRHLLRTHKMSWHEIKKSYESCEDSFQASVVTPQQLVQIKHCQRPTGSNKSEKGDVVGMVKVVHLDSDCVEKENCKDTNCSAVGSKTKQREPLMLYKCSHCNKAFGKKVTYESHMKNCNKATSCTVLLNQSIDNAVSQDVNSWDDFRMEAVGTSSDGDPVMKQTCDEQNRVLNGNTPDQDNTGTRVMRRNIEKFKNSLYKAHLSSHHSLSEECIRQLWQITDKRKRLCLLCGMKFSAYSSLQMHAVRHWKRFKCKLCGYRGFNRSEVKTHLKYSHPVRTAGLGDLNKYVVSTSEENKISCLTVNVSHSPEVKTAIKKAEQTTVTQTRRKSLSKVSPASRAGSSCGRSGSRRSSPNAASSNGASSKCNTTRTSHTPSTQPNQRAFNLRPCRALKHSCNSQDKK